MKKSFFFSIIKIEAEVRSVHCTCILMKNNAEKLFKLTLKER